MNKPKTENIPMELLCPLFEEMLKSGSVTFTVTGISMQPMLYNRRDTVTLSPAPKKLKKGDLPLFKTDEGKFILHRVIKIHSDGSYECRGDNRWESEDNIPHGNIIGVVTEFVRNGKRHSVKNPLYRLYVWLWPLLHHFKKYYKYLYIAKRRLAGLIADIKALARPAARLTVKRSDGKMTEIKLRRATAADIPEIQKLCAELIEYEEESFGIKGANKYWFLEDDGKALLEKFRENHFLYTAVGDGRPVGYLRGNISRHLSLRQPVAYLQNIYIRPEYRGTGIGSELIRLFKEYCRDNDCGEINVTFADGNTRGEEFYRTQGFEELTRTFKLEVK